MRRHRLVPLVTIVALAVGALNVHSAAAAKRATTPQRGGSVKVVDSIAQPSLDAALRSNAGGGGSNMGNAIYDVLITTDLVTGKVRPGIAEGLTTKDGINWTLKLRSGVKFSDGTSLDANAVQ